MTNRRARWTFWLLTAFQWFPVGFLLPVLVLTMEERGLSLGQVGLVFAAYSITTAVFELPTGGLADELGRKPVMMLAAALNLVMALMWLANSTFVPFLIGASLGGLGRALSTGPLEAWFVDTMHEVASEESLRPGLAGAGVADALGIALSALSVSAISFIPSLPADGPILSVLRLPPLLAAVFTGVHFLAIWLLLEETRPEPKPWKEAMGGIPSTMLRTFRIVTKVGPLRLLLGATILMGVASATIEMLYQPFFSQLLDSSASAARLFGFLVFGLALASGIGAAIASKVPEGRGLNAGGFAAVGLLLWAVAAGLFSASESVVRAVVLFLALYLFIGFAYPFLQQILHGGVSSAERSTMVSAWSLAGQSGVLVTGTVMAQLAARTTVSTALLAAAGTALIVALLALRIGLKYSVEMGVLATAIEPTDT